MITRIIWDCLSAYCHIALFVGVLIIRALPFGVRAPDIWKLPIVVACWIGEV